MFPDEGHPFELSTASPASRSTNYLKSKVVCVSQYFVLQEAAFAVFSLYFFFLVCNVILQTV